MKVFAAHNPDDEIRRQSSSGGVFTMLSERIIGDGGVVYGAAFDADWRVVHRRVDTVEGLSALRGSKYVYSHVGSAYTDALADLADGRKVLFSGTPCQIAAMRQRAGADANLMLVEIVCHGAPQPDYWRRYLSEQCQRLHRQPSDIASINFRDKRTGWKNYSFTIRFKDGKVFTQPHDDNIYMRAFLKDYTLRDACFRCPFKYPDGSRADITLGDLWGITQLAPEIDNDKGTTLVISLTLNGNRAVSTLALSKEISFDDASKFNPAITTSALGPSNLKSFIELSTNGPLIRSFRRFAGRSIVQAIYLNLSRLKHKLVEH